MADSKRSKRISRDENRGHWKSKTEFFLSLIGYAIGIGNVWRFPYICYRSGGGAFLVPYLLMVILCGIPLFYMEVLIGQFSGTGCTGMFRLAPILKGAGIAQIIVNSYCVSYYSAILALPIRMISYCFQDPAPWIGCDHKWNTENCTQIDDLRDNEDFQTSAYEFFNIEVLKISKSIEELGTIVWQQTLSLFITWVIIYLCIARGIKSVGKVVYFTAPFPYLLLIILFVRGVTLPGAAMGIQFYMYPKWEKLLDLKVWADAAVQMFFGIGPGWGGIVNMASFNKFYNNARYDAIIITTINVFTSIFAGFVVFSVLGYLSFKSGIPVEDVATSGAGLAFVTYPEAISELPVPQLWGALFFFMLFLLGIDSVFVQLESVISSFLDEFECLRNHKKKFTLFVAIFFFLSAIIMTTNGGMYILNLLDWYATAIAVIFICLIEIVMVSYIYGLNNFLSDAEFMLGDRPGWFYRITWFYITPAVLLFILIMSIMFLRTVSYNDQEYPGWAVMVGWATCASSIICIPIYIIYIMIKKRKTLKASLKKRLRPLDWTPADPEDALRYEFYRRQKKMPDFMSETDGD